MVWGLCGCWFLIAWLSHKKITCSYCLAISLFKTNLDMGGIFSDPDNDFICMTAFSVFAMWNFAVTNLENLTSLSVMEEVKCRKGIQQRFSTQKVWYRLQMILIKCMPVVGVEIPYTLL